MVVAWAANFGHTTDGGGAVPGSLPTAAKSIFEEGIQIPITKLASRTVWDQSLLNIIYRNCRLPEWNRADTLALVAACKLAGKRMIELYTRFVDKTHFGAIDKLFSRNPTALQSLIRTVIPVGPVYFEEWIDDDGQGAGLWKIACTMSQSTGALSLISLVLIRSRNLLSSICSAATCNSAHSL